MLGPLRRAEGPTPLGLSPTGGLRTRTERQETNRNTNTQRAEGAEGAWGCLIASAHRNSSERPVAQGGVQNGPERAARKRARTGEDRAQRVDQQRKENKEHKTGADRINRSIGPYKQPNGHSRERKRIVRAAKYWLQPNGAEPDPHITRQTIGRDRTSENVRDVRRNEAHETKHANSRQEQTKRGPDATNH